MSFARYTGSKLKRKDPYCIKRSLGPDGFSKLVTNYSFYQMEYKDKTKVEYPSLPKNSNWTLEVPIDNEYKEKILNQLNKTIETFKRQPVQIGYDTHPTKIVIGVSYLDKNIHEGSMIIKALKSRYDHWKEWYLEE